MRKLVALLFIALLPTSTTGCNALDCGPGTIERDGACEPATDTPDPASCGPGTMLAPSGKCEPILPPAMCDPDTTEPIIDPDTGVIICVGTGAGDCNTPLAGCDIPAAGTMTVCGKIFDVEDDTQLGAASADTSECPPAGEATGPCALTVTAYDALAFIPNPSGATPLATGQTYLDHCGRYKLRNINISGVAFIGLAVEDNPAQPDNHKLTGVAFASQANQARLDVVAYTTRNMTDATWTAGTGEGTSLAAQGVYVSVFRDHGVTGDPLAGNPALGVQLLNGGSPLTADDYYFLDTNPSMRAMVAPTSQMTTGANGSVLALRRGSLTPWTGTMGPLPAGCMWTSTNGLTIPTVVLVQIHNPAIPPPASACAF